MWKDQFDCENIKEQQQITSKRAQGLNGNENTSGSDGEAFKGDGRGVWEWREGVKGRQRGAIVR